MMFSLLYKVGYFCRYLYMIRWSLQMRKWEYLVLVENVRSLKSLQDLAKDDELYADQLRQGNYAPSLNKYGNQGWELVSASRVGGGRALTEYVFKRPKE